MPWRRSISKRATAMASSFLINRFSPFGCQLACAYLPKLLGMSPVKSVQGLPLPYLPLCGKKRA